jgi:hypothetical protein
MCVCVYGRGEEERRRVPAVMSRRVWIVESLFSWYKLTMVSNASYTHVNPLSTMNRPLVEFHKSSALHLQLERKKEKKERKGREGGRKK